MIDYSGLKALLELKGITRSGLGKELGISSRTIAKISKGEKLSHSVMERICDYFECVPEEICREVSDNPLLQVLRDEKSGRISGGIYHELQVRMTYNSNHMEGSRLTADQTRLIFETDIVSVPDGVPVDDILETVHHFTAVDFCIDVAEEPLSEDIIKKLHYILKHDTKDDVLEWFAVGEYKKRANMVGGKDTTAPEDVGKEMKKLLDGYLGKELISFEDIVDFHVRFERIHPFLDGNGRVGRLIAFKECLKHGIVPFIIEDRKKTFYYRGLAEWNREKGYLMGTCLDGQDEVKALLEALGVEE